MKEANNPEVSAENGTEHIAPKAADLRKSLALAASVALLDIDENERAALDKIRQEAGEKRGKIRKQLQEMMASSDMKVVRKFWNTRNEDMFMHFLGDRTRVGGFGSEGNV
jgi:dsDNA-specific endonuclease/ATPase MutS2